MKGTEKIWKEGICRIMCVYVVWVCVCPEIGATEDGSGVIGSDPAEWEETNGLLLSPPGRSRPWGCSANKAGATQYTGVDPSGSHLSTMI